MNAKHMLAWCRSSTAQYAIENHPDELRSYLLMNCKKRPLDKLVQDYDEALDLLDMIGGEDPDAWALATLHTSVVKEAHDAAMLERN